MKDIAMQITNGGASPIATRTLVPETLIEKIRGMCGTKAEAGLAMLWEFTREQYQLFDMICMKEPIGYLACNKDKRVVDVGVLQPGFEFKLVKVKYWIEVMPSAIEGINKGDVLKW